MSGHSKWSSIKHKKAIIDAKKGKAFTKLAANIYTAAKQGGGDVEKNFRLRLAIDQAKAANMPSTNIDRAIKKGTGEIGGATVEEILYEGYGPAGVAVLIEAATDNRNRTSGDVRSTFTKNGGSLGETGSVAYLFDRKGQIQLTINSQQLTEDDLELAIIESGADDFEKSDGEILVYTKPAELMQVVNVLRENGIKMEGAELTYLPKTEVTIKDQLQLEKIIKLIDALEELDDIINVNTNAGFDLPE